MTGSPLKPLRAFEAAARTGSFAAAARFHETYPSIELTMETATRAQGSRHLAAGECDLHCGGIDSGHRLFDFLRRERFLEITAGIVAARDHPLLDAAGKSEDLMQSHLTNIDARATALCCSAWNLDPLKPGSVNGLERRSASNTHAG